MRNIDHSINIFDILNKTANEHLLYMRQDELLNKKAETDEALLKYNHDITNIKDFMRYEHSFPEPSAAFQFCLKKSAIISLVLLYKFNNTE